MYKQLKKKLIIMYWLTSSFILTCIIVTILIMNNRQDQKNDMLNFERLSVSSMEQMGQATILSHVWLKKLEQENQWYIQGYEDKVNLNLPNINPCTEEINHLFQQLNGQRLQSQIYEFYSNQDENISDIVSLVKKSRYEYYGRVYQYKRNQSKRTILIIQKMKTLFSRCVEDIGVYTIFEVIGSLFLFLLSVTYVNYVVRPVEEADQKQKEFIASVSHELRSPLAVVQVGISSMKEELQQYENQGKMKSYINPMESECMRMNRLIEDMLLLAATDQKNWTIHMKEVDIETVLIDCYDAFSMMNHNRLQIQLPKQPLPYIQGDEERIKQVIMILLDNAMSYTDLSEKILLAADSSEKEVQIEIIDHGEGMSEEEKKKVFDRFYRRDSARSDKKHFGLGLSIAARLIQLHHGNIEVKDTIGHGTTFVVHLPV